MPIQTLEQHYLVPQHYEGKQKDLLYTVNTDTWEEADEIFVDSMARLLKIFEWNKLNSAFSLSFTQLANNGKTVSRKKTWINFL